MSKKKTLLVILACLGVLTCLGVFVCSKLPTFGTSYTLADFDSKEDAWEFVNDHLPVALPESAEIRELKYESWQEWDLEATIILPVQEAQEFRAELESFKDYPEWFDSTSEVENEVKYFLKGSHAYGSVKFYPSTGKIVIVCFTM
ncbi:MAG: hypothetical protein ACYS8Z_03705 [Planctomycetota bacterium]|jgi:hypothetical protein